MGFKLPILALTCLCAVAASACNSPSPYKLTGRIDAKFVKELESFPPYANIILFSNGGDPDFAEKAARITQEKNFRFTVIGYCLSSCVEYLLPAAYSVEFKQTPIIGVHQNPSLINDIKNMDSNFVERRLCYFEDNIDFFENFRINKATPPHKATLEQSNLAVLSRLKLVKALRIENDYCIETAFQFENQMWLPTSDQLSYHWNLTPLGKICADDYDTCGSKIDKSLPHGTRVVIGDKVYISQNQNQ